MSNVRLPAPKRRKGPRLGFDPALPVPIPENTLEPPAVDNWNYFTGDLVGDHVLVRHSGDMDVLYRMGFFGKGNLSRNKPEYNEEFWTFRKRRKYGMGDHLQERPLLRVIPKRQYLSHLAWKKQQLSPGPLPTTNTSTSVQPSIQAPSKAFSHKCNERLPLPHSDSDVTVSCDTSIDVTDTVMTEPSVASQRTMKLENHSEVTLETDPGWVFASSKDASDWLSPQKEQADTWSGMAQEQSADFWGAQASDSTNNKDVADFSQLHNSRTCPARDRSETTVPNPQADSGKTEKQITAAQCIEPVKNVSQTSVLVAAGDLEDDSAHASPASQPEDTTYEPIVEPQSEERHTKTSLSQTGLSLQTASTASKTDDTEDKNLTLEQQPEADETPPLPVTLDPLCVHQDAAGSLQVVEDSDSEPDGGVGLTEGPGAPKWIPTQKLDPYLVLECLQLTFEEAFFLSYGLGCLIVLDEKQKPLDLTTMWRLFCGRRSNFIHSYVAYHSLRSRGWVPKTGIKYGADFLIYHKGPPYYHGSYSVFVRTATEPDLADDLDLQNPTLTWTTLMGMDRVTETVAKEPLLLLVIPPRDLTEEEVTSPNCVRRFKVQEILLKRWVPSKEREAAEVAEWL